MVDMRLVFAKTGRIRFISHLDLQRVWQRAFSRAELPLRHSEGFNPHAKISMALPLPVGMASRCELLDFSLESPFSPEQVQARLNEALPEGLRVSAVLTERRPVSEIAWVSLDVRLVWPEQAIDLSVLESGEPLMIARKTKKGVVDFDLTPHLRDVQYEMVSTREANVTCKASAQNPTINPEHIRLAVGAFTVMAERNALWDKNLLAFMPALC